MVACTYSIYPKGEDPCSENSRMFSVVAETTADADSKASKECKENEDCECIEWEDAEW